MTAQEAKETWIEPFDEGLFYKVPRRMISFIHSDFKPKLLIIEIDVNYDLDAMQFSLLDWEKNEH